MPTNLLEVLIRLPEKFRTAVYSTFILAAVIVGCLNAADVNTGKTTDVLTYLGGLLSLQAVTNVPAVRAKLRRDPGDRGLVNPSPLLTVLLVVLVSLAILWLLGVRFNVQA